jgi:hypothetical protein
VSETLDDGWQPRAGNGPWLESAIAALHRAFGELVRCGLYGVAAEHHAAAPVVV